MKNLPAYGIGSVDHALRLALLLQQEGPIRVADAADRLGVARSTAHRLLAMLVYRDFAEQDDSRAYVVGPVLRRTTTSEPVNELRRLAAPHLEALMHRINETTNVVVMIGDQVRFVATVECAQMLRVGDREGRMLPAHLTSGGKVVLASMSDEDVAKLYDAPDSPVSDLEPLMRTLRRVRRMGFAINDQSTEVGLTAIGRIIRVPAGMAPAAVSIAMPTARFHRDRLQQWVQNLAATAERIERDLATAARHPSSAKPARRAQATQRTTG